MIRVVDAFDARCQASGLGRFLAAAAETGVVDGTILVSVKFHGSALVCFRVCCALLCRWGVLLCSASVKRLKCGAGPGARCGAHANAPRCGRNQTFSGRSPSWGTSPDGPPGINWDGRAQSHRLEALKSGGFDGVFNGNVQEITHFCRFMSFLP